MPVENVCVCGHNNTITNAGRGEEWWNYLNVIRGEDETGCETGYDAKGEAVDNFFIAFNVSDVADLGPYGNCQAKEGKWKKTVFQG